MFFFMLFGFFFCAATQAFAKDSSTTILIKNNATWKFARSVTEGWKLSGYDDSLWDYVAIPSRGLCQGAVDDFESDPMWATNPVAREIVYFRKEIILEGEPLSAHAQIVMDDDGELYINGEVALASSDGIVSLTQGDVASHLHKGLNTIAIRVDDTFGGCQYTQLLIEVEVPVSEDHQLDVPLIKQTAKAWSDVTYAGGSKDDMFCGMTIGDCGCVISSLSMLLAFHGITKGPSGFATTPDNVNDYFLRNQTCGAAGCVSSGYAYGEVVWSAVHEYAKKAYELFGSPKIMLVEAAPYNKAKVEDDIKNNKPIILKAPHQSHWFVASGIVGTTFSIRDPLFDWTELQNPDYKNSASQMRRFTKVNSDFSAIEVFVKEPDHILITAPDGKRVGFDKTQNKVVNEIENAVYLLEGDMSAGIRHALIQEPVKGEYIIQTVSDQKKEIEYSVYKSNRAAEIIRSTMQSPPDKPNGVAYDPDFSQPAPTPTTVPRPTALPLPTKKPTTRPTPTILRKPTLTPTPTPNFARIKPWHIIHILEKKHHATQLLKLWSRLWPW